jgi:hypothetical protein
VSKSWLSSGRIETLLALLVLLVVLGLFVKFRNVDVPTPTEIDTPAAMEPSSPSPTQ